MEAFFRTHTYLVEHTNAPVHRTLMDEIDWNDRMIGIRGSRGIGKTTFLLQYAKEHFDPRDRQCLYVNMNNFYFQGHGICDFAGEFYKRGGRTLLIDQVFKQPNWSKDLRLCYDYYPGLKIVFTGSSVMRMQDDFPELSGIAKIYSLRGFSFREYLNLMTGSNFKACTLDDILNDHKYIIKHILPDLSPLKYFDDYLHHGFYPFFLENRNFSENLLKTMNMMTEVDILLIKQIELKYLAKVNILYPVGEEFPKKPARVMLHNTNLQYVIYPLTFTEQEVMETFFVGTLRKEHQVNVGAKPGYYIIDNKHKFRICDATNHKVRYSNDVVYARYHTEIGEGNKIPLWLFGFLY